VQAGINSVISSDFHHFIQMISSTDEFSSAFLSLFVWGFFLPFSGTYQIVLEVKTFWELSFKFSLV